MVVARLLTTMMMVTMMIQVACVAQSHHTKLENVPLKLASILNGTTVISRSQWREHFKSNKNWTNDNFHQNAWNWNFYLVAVILPGFYAALEEFASRHCSSFLIFTKNNSKYLLHLQKSMLLFWLLKQTIQSICFIGENWCNFWKQCWGHFYGV